MLIYSMTVSLDGFIADRDGDISWGGLPSDELFAFHLARVAGLGAYLCGRRLYQAMLPWETDPSMRNSALTTEFAEVWSARPKTVFSRTLHSVEGNARLAGVSPVEEIPAVLASTGSDVEIGGASLAAVAIERGLVDELRTFRMPVLLGGGTPYLPPVTGRILFDLIETRTFDARVVYERHRRAEAR